MKEKINALVTSDKFLWGIMGFIGGILIEGISLGFQFGLF